MITTKHFEAIAKVAHNVNKAYCEATGDLSQVSWEDAPDWQRESAIEGVYLHMTHPTTPEMSHVSWMNFKLNDNWTWGPVKDADLKQHPCLVPYNELPEEQKMKDILFKAVVESSIENLVAKKNEDYKKLVTERLKGEKDKL